MDTESSYLCVDLALSLLWYLSIKFYNCLLLLDTFSYIHSIHTHTHSLYISYMLYIFLYMYFNIYLLYNLANFSNSLKNLHFLNFLLLLYRNTVNLYVLIL